MPLPEEVIAIIETQLYVDDYEWVESLFEKLEAERDALKAERDDLKDSNIHLKGKCDMLEEQRLRAESERDALKDELNIVREDENISNADAAIYLRDMRQAQARAEAAEAERDEWKASAEALERALIEVSDEPCDSCEHRGNAPACVDCRTNNLNYEFDFARFTPEVTDDE